MIASRSYNRRVSGFATLRPNLRSSTANFRYMPGVIRNSPAGIGGKDDAKRIHRKYKKSTT